MKENITKIAIKKENKFCSFILILKMKKKAIKMLLIFLNDHETQFFSTFHRSIWLCFYFNFLFFRSIILNPNSVKYTQNIKCAIKFVFFFVSSVFSFLSHLKYKFSIHTRDTCTIIILRLHLFLRLIPCNKRKNEKKHDEQGKEIEHDLMRMRRIRINCVFCVILLHSFVCNTTQLK